jgi:GNAT superfamily N-acetyltransferase
MPPKTVSPPSHFPIFQLTRSDVPEILAMIHELAAFENESDSVQATKASLLATLSFPKTPNATALSDFTPGFARTFLLLAPSPDTSKLAVAGMAMFFTNYSTWRGAPGIYLEDLFVRPAFRRRGYANQLLRELARETQRLGGKRLEWACLKWNEGALGFYDGLGAKRMEEWVGLRVDGDALGKLAGEGKE